MRQYEMAEIAFKGAAPRGSEAVIDLNAVFSKNGKDIAVKGFYAGDGVYKVRFLPEEAGSYEWRLYGEAAADLRSDTSGTMSVEPADKSHHGPVRPEGIHLRHADGTWFYSFGTTVYALAHQSDALTEETLQTLQNSPFNKVRMCLFPKHYNYNHNNPKYYAFERSAAGEGKTFEVAEGTEVGPGSEDTGDAPNNWDVNRPCYPFWDAFEEKIARLADMGIEVDLILFHPYDRWGFNSMPQKDNLIYLDYLLRRLSAFPNVWWSLANEYDICRSKTLKDWEEIEEFTAANDPFHHMLSNHNCFRPWDWARENVTHISWQSKQMSRVAELARKYGKPVLYDECRYEGNLPEFWGNISGKDMTQRFWQVTTAGGYCTHGETFFPGTEEAKKNTDTGESEVVWWARGGKLHGESPARIAFLRDIIESLPGPLSPAASGLGTLMGTSREEKERMLQSVPAQFRDFLSNMIYGLEDAELDKFLAVEYSYSGKCDNDEAFLFYKDTECCAQARINLPADKSYKVEVIDTWEMTREAVMTGVSGTVDVKMPGKPYMAVLATKI